MYPCSFTNELHIIQSYKNKLFLDVEWLTQRSRLRKTKNLATLNWLWN